MHSPLAKSGGPTWPRRPAVFAARAQERYAAEPAAYDANGRARDATSRQTGATPRGRPPTPPTPGPRDKDQGHVTAPASGLMDNSPTDGFDQHDQAQAAVAQASGVMVASTLSHPPNAPAEALPPVDASPLAWGTPQAGALDPGSCRATTIAAMDARDLCAVPRHRADTPSSPVAVVLCAAARAPASACESEAPEGRHTPQRDGRGDLPLAERYRRTGAGPYPRPRGRSPRRAAGLAGRRWRMVAGGSGLQLDASADLDPGIRVPPAGGSEERARRTRWGSGTKRAETPHAPGRARRRAGGVSGPMVDDGRVAKPCRSPSPLLPDRLLGFDNVEVLKKTGLLFKNEWVGGNRPSTDIPGFDVDEKGNLAPFPGHDAFHGGAVAEIASGGRALQSVAPSLLPKMLELHLVKVSSAAPDGGYRIRPGDLVIAISNSMVVPDIIQISVGRQRPMPDVERVLVNGGNTLAIVAAGNDGQQLSRTGWYPANYGGPQHTLEGKIIVVGAMAPNKQIATFSNFDPDRVDLLAPGCQLYYESGESRVELIGTSFAAPFVTLVTGLLRSIGIKNPKEIRRRLIAATDFDIQLKEKVWSSGVLNAEKALYVFDDLLEMKHSGQLLRGVWERQEDIKPCEDASAPKVDMEKLIKLTPVFAANGTITSIRYLFLNNDGRLDKYECTNFATMGPGVKFKRIGGSNIEEFGWSEIADVVARH